MNNIKKLRKFFRSFMIDGYLVPKNDEYFNEYVSESSDKLKFISNFSGSAGFAIILKNKNYLFVDGRYTIQARIQSGKNFTIITIPQKFPKDILKIKKKLKIGFDPKLHSEKQLNFLFNVKNIILKPINRNLIDEIHQFKVPKSKSFYSLDNKIAGENYKSKINKKFPLFQTVLNAAKEAGYDLYEDVNGYKQEGFGPFDVTINNGMRYGVVKAYLDKVKEKSNVKIFTHANVLRILFKNKTAVGIEVEEKSQKVSYFANKEILLSAGSINSPKILQLSGVGDAQELKKHDIKIIHDLPGVGKNLQDHLEVYIQYKSKKKETLYDLSTNYLTQAIEGIKWFLFKRGLLVHSHLELGGFVTTDTKYLHPNLQYHFFPSLVINHGLINPSFDGFQFHVTPNRPKSRGFVKLKSPNPEEDPFIQFNYLQEEEDLIQMREGVQIARKIFSQPSFEPYLGEEIRPGKNCNTEEINEIIRNTADSAYHPSCTNKMGKDKMSVVDEDTKVHGINNLRIIDSSIMPDIVSGNINAATLMIAEKGSDLILQTEEQPIKVS